jgi:hypothetical protein
MNISLSKVNLEGFVVRVVEFCGEQSLLIFPQHIGVKFTQQNKIFRSSIWSLSGELLSAGFPKFTNYGENPENFPVPTSLKNCNIIFKEDGSLAIVDFYNNRFNVRSRGTVDATFLDNGAEWEENFRKMLINGQLLIESHPEYSFLFEFVTPNQRIVLRYPSPQYILVGAINKTDYSLATQLQLDIWANQYKLNRPRRFSFSTIDELKLKISEYKGIEGCCLYSHNDQVIHKIKSEEYLVKHRLKDELGSFERVVDFYFTQNQPNFNDFYQAIVDTVDWETAEECRGHASRIIDGMKEVNKILAGMKAFSDKWKKDGLSRKQFATEVFQAYGNTNRSGMVFTIFDGKDLKERDLKRLLYQVLKK